MLKSQSTKCGNFGVQSPMGRWQSGSETVLYTIKGEVGYMVVTVGKATENETCLSKINKQGETYMLPLK